MTAFPGWFATKSLGTGTSSVTSINDNVGLLAAQASAAPAETKFYAYTAKNKESQLKLADSWAGITYTAAQLASGAAYNNGPGTPGAATCGFSVIQATTTAQAQKYMQEGLTAYDTQPEATTAMQAKPGCSNSTGCGSGWQGALCQIANAFNSVGNFFGDLGQPAFWVRAGKVVVGLVLITAGVMHITGMSKDVIPVLGAAASKVPA
jgi:hypothetical protein